MQLGGQRCQHPTTVSNAGSAATGETALRSCATGLLATASITIIRPQPQPLSSGYRGT